MKASPLIRKVKLIAHTIGLVERMCLGSFDRAICLRPRFMSNSRQERCPRTAGFANVNHPRTLRMQHRHVHHHVPLERDREENHRAAPIADPSTADCDANGAAHGDSDTPADPAAHLDINESANSDARPHGHTDGDSYANCHTDRDGKCHTITVAQRSAYRYAAGLADPAACSGPDKYCHGGRDAPPSAQRNRFTTAPPTISAGASVPGTPASMIGGFLVGAGSVGGIVLVAVALLMRRRRK